MNLLERMTEANAATVKEFSAKYPITGGELVRELNRNTSWLDLSYRSVTQLVEALGGTSYSPMYIDNLFPNK